VASKNSRPPRRREYLWFPGWDVVCIDLPSAP
jgi:hypothetical protein